MATIDLRDLLEIINYTKTTRIETAPTDWQAGRWALHKGEYLVHTARYPFTLLYLNSSASLEDVKGALRASRDFPDRHVVYPASFSETLLSNPEVERLLRSDDRRWTSRQYLLSFISSEVVAYRAKIDEQAPKDYIDPKIETPSGFLFKIPNPVLSFLQEQQPDPGTGQLGIVLAEPGQGKTYMSRYIASRLAEIDRGLVPLMVDSSQWHSMSPDDQRSLEKTIAHSFRHFGAPIGWLEGHESEFLRVALKADLIRVVFDGFDEYILRNGGAVQPLDVLQSLADLTGSTGARIVITSRTSFWDANYSDTEIAKFVEDNGALIYRIEPFDIEHARNYFKKKLDEQKVARAITIYSTLRETNREFVGRGFVLNLIADVASEEGTSAAANELRTPMRWLTKALCRREEVRQDLPLTADDQLNTFRTFAVEVAEGAEPNTELLEISIQIIRPTLDVRTLRGTVDKLRSHPLVAYEPASRHWAFKQDQISIFFLAEQIIQWDAGDALLRFVQKARLLPESWQDLGSMIVDILVKRSPPDDATAALQRLIQTMSPVDRGQAAEIGNPDGGGRLASILSLMAVERLLQQRASSHTERAELLRFLSGGTAVSGLKFSGIIARYDFRGMEFFRCRFDRVTWANCKFDERTEFVECQFFGGVPPRYTEGFGRARFTRTLLDPEAEAIRNSERIREGQKRYTRDDLRTDLHALLSKFVGKGGVAPKTVEAASLTKGTISNSRHRDEIVDVVKATILEEHHISGRGVGYHVRADARDAVAFYATNNVFTGPLRTTWERLREKLNL